MFKFITPLIFVFFITAKAAVIRKGNVSLFEGDIAGISADLIEDLIKLNNSANSTLPSGAPINDPFKLWPDGAVYYSISSDFDENQRNVIMEAINDYHQQTCIKFYERNSEPDYVMIEQRDGCFSAVGRSGGMQTLSLGPGCVYKGIVIHEMMHALGFFHEQSRWDRDEYIYINLDNVQEGKENNFLKYELGTLKDLSTPYDYQSIMHYERNAFSSNGEATIVPTPDENVQIGQREGLSEVDIKEIQLLYQCDGGNGGNGGGGGDGGDGGDGGES